MRSLTFWVVFLVVFCAYFECKSTSGKDDWSWFKDLFSSSSRSGSSYGSTFGKSGLPVNTYISNNYFGGYRSGVSFPFLSDALFIEPSYRHLQTYKSPWNADDDRKWRKTTKAPYFENKLPWSENYLPAAAVVGAATAFGLATLLPLNIPANKPLMYCNNANLAQMPIQIDDSIYTCIGDKIVVSCAGGNGRCFSRIMECDLKNDVESLFCTNAMLISRIPIVCDSTRIRDTSNLTVLDCFEGELPEAMAAFIPTTTKAPSVKKNELSFGAIVHVFLLHLIGKGEVLKKSTKLSTDKTTPLRKDESLWVPEALTMPSKPKPSKGYFIDLNNGNSVWMSNDHDERNEVFKEYRKAKRS